MRLNYLDDATQLESPLSSVELGSPPIAHHVRYRGPGITGTYAAPASGGWLVQPPQVVLALPGWEDAFETIVDDELHTLFDIEKIVRMLLHGSHLAMEILGAPAAFVRHPASRDVLEWTVNQRHLGAARDSAAFLSETNEPGEVDLLDHTRRYLQGAALARGDFSMNLAVLATRLNVQLPETVEDAREILDAVTLNPDHGVLPAGPDDYDALSAWLVEQRLEAR